MEVPNFSYSEFKAPLTQCDSFEAAFTNVSSFFDPSYDFNASQTLAYCADVESGKFEKVKGDFSKETCFSDTSLYYPKAEACAFDYFSNYNPQQLPTNNNNTHLTTSNNTHLPALTNNNNQYETPDNNNNDNNLQQLTSFSKAKYFEFAYSAPKKEDRVSSNSGDKKNDGRKERRNNG